MKSSGTLLVGTDFSEIANNAVINSATLAHQLGYRLRILHAIDFMGMESSEWPKDGEIEAKLETLISSLPEDVEYESAIEEADPRKILIRESEKPEIAAVVVGYSGKSGLVDRIGSVASKAARLIKKPVFILTSSFDTKSKLIGCLDFSDTTKIVIDWVNRLAQRSKDPALFVHVAIPLKRLIEYNLGDGADDSPIPTFGGSESVYREHLNSALRRLEGLRKDDDLSILFDDSPCKALEDVSAEWYPSLLVLGRHEHNRLHERILGSTAEHILKYSNCSTLVVMEE